MSTSFNSDARANACRALRTHYRALRRNLSVQQQQTNASAAAQCLASSTLLLRPASVGLFVSQDAELDTAPIINLCLSAGHQVALPCVERNARMLFRRYQQGEPLLPGAYNIPEPAAAAPIIPGNALTAVFTPLVAFDDLGNRLGMGGGYYDRYLDSLSCEERPLVVGLCHQLQHSNTQLPTAPWDVPLDMVLTELGFTAFSDAGRAGLRQGLGYTARPSEPGSSDGH